jgi:hypothetical protein
MRCDGEGRADQRIFGQGEIVKRLVGKANLSRIEQRIAAEVQNAGDFTDLPGDRIVAGDEHAIERIKAEVAIADGLLVNHHDVLTQGIDGEMFKSKQRCSSSIEPNALKIARDDGIPSQLEHCHG